MNPATLIGRAVQDAEIKESDQGRRFAYFCLLTSERWRDRGIEKTHTESHVIAVWREDLVDIAERFLKRGAPLLIEGVLRSQIQRFGDKPQAVTEIMLTGHGARLDVLAVSMSSPSLRAATPMTRRGVAGAHSE